MKRLQIALLVFALFCPLVAARAAPLDAPKAAGQGLNPALTYLPYIAEATKENWVIMRVTPDNISYGNITSGHYTVLQQLGPVLQSTEGTYYWPYQPSFAYTGPPKGYALLAARRYELSLFQPSQNKSRCVLCILTEKASMQTKFFDVHLVPPGWENSVLPAILFLRSHPQPVFPAATGTQQAETRALLSSGNPYLQVTALQVLAARRSLTTADVDIALSSPDQSVTAVTVALIRFYGWADSDVNAHWLTTRIANLTSLDQLQVIAYGIFATRPLYFSLTGMTTGNLPALPIVEKSSRSHESILETEVIPAIRLRLKELAPDLTPADTRLRD